MRCSLFIAVTMLVFAGTAAGQTKTDSQTLEAILEQLRQLRQDLRNTSVAAQRGEILLYRVQMQQTVVTRLQQRVDDAQSKLLQIQQDEKRISSRATSIDDSLANADDPKTQKDLQDLAKQLKAALEAQANSEQDVQAKLAEAQDQLRVEQAKLGRLQDELDRLDKALQEFAAAASSSQ